MHKNYNCNACDRGSNCSGDLVRHNPRVKSTDFGLGDWKAKKLCPGYYKLQPMRVSLLEASSNKPGFAKEVGRILSNAKLTLKASNGYPFFRLIFSK